MIVIQPSDSFCFIHHDVRNIGRAVTLMLEIKRQEDASDKPLMFLLISLFKRAYHHIAHRFWYLDTNYIRIPSALTDHILRCIYHNITPPVSLCLSTNIVDSPFKPIHFTLNEGISPIPDQSNEFPLLIHPYCRVFHKGEIWQKCGRGEETEQD